MKGMKIALYLSRFGHRSKTRQKKYKSKFSFQHFLQINGAPMYRKMKKTPDETAGDL
ncbi:hypothetical protein BAXH7_01707 [Bacillus amyloliquefaciens XH7]|nr:hypothetical protein BAMTA208_08375 [Bacillus amyloliquefaciens TA208]AEB63451.1 hypothetical protein LL3_01912 [Bacillus amyloliquefaciens LL3]AEK88843.1 hypothetical protein BAXH7_01707 [Bacillus amyloliquefaciens XH7]KYC95000.1 hypothetical protein B425_1912 [Bacillus amyloliquefaciens]